MEWVVGLTGSSGSRIDRSLSHTPPTNSVIGGKSKTVRDSWRPSPVNGAINCARPSVAWSLRAFQQQWHCMQCTCIPIANVYSLFVINQVFLIKFRFWFFIGVCTERLLGRDPTLKRRKGSTILRSYAFSLVNLLQVNELLVRQPCPQILTPSTH